MLDLSPEQLRIVRTILAAHVGQRQVRVFGSRVTGHAKPYSDLDLVIMGKDPLPDPIRAELMADFEESALPFRVDVLEWRDAPASLREVITREGMPIYP